VFSATGVKEILRSAAQGISFVFSSATLEEYLKAVSQALNFVFSAIGIKEGDFFVSASQTISFVFNGDRLIEVSKPVSQALNFVFSATGVKEILRSAAQGINFIVHAFWYEGLVSSFIMAGWLLLCLILGPAIILFLYSRRR